MVLKECERVKKLSLPGGACRGPYCGATCATHTRFWTTGGVEMATLPYLDGNLNFIVHLLWNTDVTVLQNSTRLYLGIQIFAQVRYSVLPSLFRQYPESCIFGEGVLTPLRDVLRCKGWWKVKGKREERLKEREKSKRNQMVIPTEQTTFRAFSVSVLHIRSNIGGVVLARGPKSLFLCKKGVMVLLPLGIPAPRRFWVRRAPEIMKWEAGRVFFHRKVACKIEELCFKERTFCNKHGCCQKFEF